MMGGRILIQYAHGQEHQDMLAATRPAHEDYCRRHGAEILLSSGDPGRRAPNWRKVELIRDALSAGFERVIWLDTDAVIVRPEFDLWTAIGYGVGVCECRGFERTVDRHLNTGVVYVASSPRVREFFDIWNGHDVPYPYWEEQGAFIDLMQTHLYRNLLTILPNVFNASAYMPAADPFVRAYHGQSDRVRLIQEGLTP